MPERTPSSTSSQPGTSGLRLRVRGFGAGPWRSPVRGLGDGLGRPAAASGSDEVERSGPAATERSGGRSKSGSISSAAASSNAVAVPPCAPGVKRKWATLSERPAFQASWTVQRPSSLRQASHVVASGSSPRADQRRRDGLQQRQHRGSVGEHRVRRGRELGGAGALQQHRVGEPLDPGGVDAGRARDLLDGCARADPGLESPWGVSTFGTSTST